MFMTVAVAVAIETLAAGPMQWTREVPLACPAWLGPTAPVVLVSDATRPRVFVGERVLDAESDGAGSYRLDSGSDEPDARVRGTLVVAQSGIFAVTLESGRCKAQGRSAARAVPVEESAMAKWRALQVAQEQVALGEREARDGRLAPAESATAKGCAALREGLGEAHALAVLCDVRRSNRARESGHYAEALELAQRANAALTSLAGAASADALAARQAQAQALGLATRPREALELVQAVARDRAALLGEAHVDTLASRNTVGALLRQLGRNGEAIATFEEILPILEQTRGAEDVDTLRVRNNLALAYQREERVREALAQFEELYRARRARQGARHPATLVALVNLAGAAFNAGDEARAARLCEQAIPDFLATYGEDHPETLRLRSRLAHYDYELGRYEESAALFESVRDAAQGKVGPTNAITLQALTGAATAETVLGRTQDALANLDKAWRGYLEAYGPDHPSTRQALQAKAHALMRAGRAAEALKVFDEELGAANLPPRSAGPVPSAALVNHASAAQARFESGRRGEAMAQLEDVLARKREQFGEDHPQTLATLVTLASFRARAGDRQAAVTLLEDLVRLTERRFAGGLAFSDTRRAALAAWVGEGWQRAGYATLATLLATSNPRRALEIAELGRGRGLEAALGARAGMRELPAATRASMLELSAQLGKTEEAIATGSAGSEAQLAHIARRSRLQDRLASAYEDATRELPWGVTATLDDRLHSLPRDAAYVSFVVADTRVAALVARADGRVRGFDLGEMPGLASAVDAWRALATSDDPSAARIWRERSGRYVNAIARPAADAIRVTSSLAVGDELSRRLLAPLLPALRDARRWIVSPDGALAFLPFDALRWQGATLVERVQVSLVPSLAQWSRLTGNAGRGTGSATAGDFLGWGVAKPGAKSPDGARLDDLPGAEGEVVRLAGLFPGSRSLTFLGSRATESALRAMESDGSLARYRYVHFATHAFLSPRDARLSGVMLARDAANADDGVVTAAEWAGLHLGADLVTLSACETALGTKAAAEGVMGLPYAMMASGAQGALLTLWRVSDEGAAQFMQAFYARIVGGARPGPALRATKTAFLRSKGPWSAPRHWAAFVLYGAP